MVLVNASVEVSRSGTPFFVLVSLISEIAAIWNFAFQRINSYRLLLYDDKRHNVLSKWMNRPEKGAPWRERKDTQEKLTRDANYYSFSLDCEKGLVEDKITER